VKKSVHVGTLLFIVYPFLLSIFLF